VSKPRTSHPAARSRTPPSAKPAAKKPGGRQTLAGDGIASGTADAAVTPPTPFIEPELRQAMISDAAYYLAEQRDFSPGHELDDWLAAEREVDHMLLSDESATGCGT
jgi:hypothetical protein